MLKGYEDVAVCSIVIAMRLCVDSWQGTDEWSERQTRRMAASVVRGQLLCGFLLFFILILWERERPKSFQKIAITTRRPNVAVIKFVLEFDASQVHTYRHLQCSFCFAGPRFVNYRDCANLLSGVKKNSYCLTLTPTCTANMKYCSAIFSLI